MRVVIHDLKDEDSAGKVIEHLGDVHVIADDGTIHRCLGCFGCWTKTPGVCVIRDAYGDMGALFSKCSEVFIISKCCYGGFSPFVKNVLDRSISYVHPYFVNKDGEMHHKRRYKNHVRLQVSFYGETTEQERETAKGVAQSIATNLWWDLAGVSFGDDIADIRGAIS
ncbi:MAG TPA: flavodoxin family protein [Firmicutes bacterium]|nr:flavodoxin family protein [Bacillota bacterium]